MPVSNLLSDPLACQHNLGDLGAEQGTAEQPVASPRELLKSSRATMPNASTILLVTTRMNVEVTATLKEWQDELHLTSVRGAAISKLPENER